MMRNVIAANSSNAASHEVGLEMALALNISTLPASETIAYLKLILVSIL